MTDKERLDWLGEYTFRIQAILKCEKEGLWQSIRDNIDELSKLDDKLVRLIAEGRIE